MLVEHGRQEVDALAPGWPPAGPGCARRRAELAVLGLVAPSGTGSESEATSVAPRHRGRRSRGLAEARAREAQTARQSAQVLGELWTAHSEGPSYLEVLSDDRGRGGGLPCAQRPGPARWCGRSRSGRRTGAGRALHPRPGSRTRGQGRGVTAWSTARASSSTPPPCGPPPPCIAAGEKARVYRDVPLNLVIGEGGVLLTAAATVGGLHGMLIGPSDLYDRLVGSFEVFWSLALPLTADTGADGDEPSCRRWRAGWSPSWPRA